jgi:tripartite-type tricarboxylate transporter receptor subunit TctC
VTIGRQDVLGCVLAALAVGFLAASPLHVAAQPAFFQGKQVRFYTMGSPGGGYDTYMRALIPHLEKKLGAKMLPTNEPGAGGLIAINRTLHAPPDGLTILLVGGETLVTAQLYDAPGVNYDVRGQVPARSTAMPISPPSWPTRSA